MKPVSPVVPGKDYPEIKIAENQPEYETIPVVKLQGGPLVSRWELTDEEKAFIAENGYFYFYQWTFRQPMQPVLLTIDAPEE